VVGVAHAATGRRLIVGAGRLGIGASTVALHVQQLEAAPRGPVDSGFEVVYSGAVKASRM
jgi:hypothetical protein